MFKAWSGGGFVVLWAVCVTQASSEYKTGQEYTYNYNAQIQMQESITSYIHALVSNQRHFILLLKKIENKNRI